MRATGILFRVLTFRATREELEQNAQTVLAVGIVVTWIVGIGRWWDDPREIVTPIRLGLGSVIYVFALATLLWLLSLPFRTGVGIWTFWAFVACAALPGIVYAVPIERIAPFETASTYNVWALIFVSVYRVALLVWFYLRILRVPAASASVLTLLPLSLIVWTLSILGHGARVFDIMGGFREKFPTNAAEDIVSGLGCLSWVLAPLLLVLYLWECAVRFVHWRRGRGSAE